MGFIHKNDGFICQHCGAENPPALKTCRNHCRECLHSLHVDEQNPGDRASTCHNLMTPVAVTGDIDNLVIHHVCVCGKKMTNKVASDDNLEEVMKIMQQVSQHS